MIVIWSVAALVACVYCIVRGIVDLRQGKYAWGFAGIASAIVIVTVPLPTQVVKVDLPAAATR